MIVMNGPARSSIPALLLAVALVSLPGCVTAASRVAGTVYYVGGAAAASPQPYAGARIQIVDGAGRPVANTWADANGRFVFGLPPGSYTIVSAHAADQIGFAPLSVTVTQGQTVHVTIRARLP